MEKNAKMLGGYSMGPPQYLYLAAWLAGALAIGLLLKRRTPLSEASRFAVVFLYLMAVPVFGFEYFRIYPVPQAYRYFLDVDAVFALAVGIAIGSRRLCSKQAWSRGLTGVALAGLTVVIVPRARRDVRAWLPKFDITKTVEYEQAMYLNGHYPGQRVFVDAGKS